MTSWLPSLIQKRLLRYAINYVGILDDEAIDLDNLDISWGRRSTVEFKNVGLNVERISGLASLPPNIRLEAARILLLRATLPANLSGISVEVDGVEVVAKLDEEQGGQPGHSGSYQRTPGSSQSPSHRKTARRLCSPHKDALNDGGVPTAADLARSFLAEEPIAERRELEATVAANTRDLEQSVASESSESSGGEIGTGAGPGLPAFLTNYLQNVVDSFQASVKNVRIMLQTEVLGGHIAGQYTGIALKVGSVQVPAMDLDTGSRGIQLDGISIDLHADKHVLSELSQMPPSSSPAASRSPETYRIPTTSTHGSNGEFAPSSSPPAHSSFGGDAARSNDLEASTDMFASTNLAEPTLAHGSRDEDGDLASSSQSKFGQLDILPGDDNVSWTSRRSHSDAPAEDIWASPAQDDLPDSLLISTGPPLAESRSSQVSGHHSQTSARSRRAVSPYDRQYQGPGSWPRLDSSPSSNRVRQSPGSWPAPDQSQHSFYQPATPGPALDEEDATDNKKSAFDASFEAAQESRSPSPPKAGDESPSGANLIQSRFFSHDEAESIYMSVMTQGPSTPMPGAWSAEDVSSERSRSPGVTRTVSTQSGGPVESSTLKASTEKTQSPAPGSPSPGPPSEAATPRAQSPSLNAEPSALTPQTILQLLYIDTVSATIPVSRAANPAEDPPPAPQRNAVPTMPRAGIPGTFSVYSEMTSSRRMRGSSSEDWRDSSLQNAPKPWPPMDATAPIDVKLGTVSVQLDIATVQLLHKIGSTLASGTDDSRTAKPQAQQRQETAAPFKLSIQKTQLDLHHQISGDLARSGMSSRSDLVGIQCRSLAIGYRQGRTDLQLGTFELSLGKSRVLAFDPDPRSMSSSVVSHEDMQINVDSSKTSVPGRAITEIDLHTRPVLLEVDLPVIDEAFNSFGGLGGVLDIGSSMLSEASPLNSPAVTSRPNRVRFQDKPPPTVQSAEIKANVRIGGSTIKLRGDSSMAVARTLTIKSVYREAAATVSIGQLQLSGPYSLSEHEAPITLDLGPLRLDYLFTPQEQDFERLLALLVPSKDKYDHDDDILIDTLLRQRRKGACLRVTLEDVKAQVTNWECLSKLESLATEVGRLAAVAKYLPEDDRPGLLSMIRVKNFEAQTPVNDRFGKLRVSLQDFHCAHVGLPALLALSMSNVRVSQVDGPELVHSVIPLSGIDNLPMMMARMLGDEAEPVVKVKLYNVCVEYSVPILLDLTSIDKAVDTEQMVAELAASVADFALGTPATEHLHRPDSEQSGPVKKTDVKVLLHNSAVGLSPQKAPSKGLLVLTDARFTTVLPPGETMDASLELHRAGIVITDDAQAPGIDANLVRRNPPENTKVDTRLLSALWKQGYASVGSIMHATIDVRIDKDAQKDTSSVNVDVRNEFLLLETCADSTQTLIGIINGLAPPTPPSKQPKYLTEPMSLDDMMSSFTGEAVTQPGPSRPSETLFDVEEEPEPDADDILSASIMGDAADDLLAESEMASSLYGPRSGVIGDLDDDPQDDGGFGETVESLLEDDPFEMTDSPDDMPFSDATLLKDLRQQCVPTQSSATVDLGNYEIEDLGFDALGTDQQALGTVNRFNTPISRRRLGKDNSKAKLPCKLRLRDVNIAWHLHDGYDWQKTRDGLTATVEQVERRAEERMARRRQSRNEYEEEESTIGDCMFNSVYITIPTNAADAQDLRRGINRQIDDLVSESESVPASGMSRPTAYSTGGRPSRQSHRKRLKLERSRHHKISFELKGVSTDVLVFPQDSGEVQSSIDVRLKQFEIIDLVPSSTWKKFLTQMPGEAGAREISKPMIHLEMLNVRTIAEHAATEIILHVTIEPLRLHVDQDALDFITRFFEFKDSNEDDLAPPNEQPFLQRVEVETVDLQLDYKPKKVDYIGLRSGHTSEFMNFVILDQANIRLRHAIIYGLHGFEPLHKTLNDIWTPDVKRNQLPTVLAGLAPVRSLVNLGSGVRDVVAIPIREYKKDGRIVRSIQKGAFQFGKTTGYELSQLGAKIFMGTQNLLAGAEAVLAPSSASPFGRRYLSEVDADPEREERQQRAYSAYAEQPLGVFAGLRSARGHLEHDLLTARDAFIAVQGEMLESGGPGSAARAMARHAPTVILRPVIGASRAVGTALLGVGNQIDRDGVRRMEDKYKRR